MSACTQHMYTTWHYMAALKLDDSGGKEKREAAAQSRLSITRRGPIMAFPARLHSCYRPRPRPQTNLGQPFSLSFTSDVSLETVATSTQVRINTTYRACTEESVPEICPAVAEPSGTGLHAPLSPWQPWQTPLADPSVRREPPYRLQYAMSLTVTDADADADVASW